MTSTRYIHLTVFDRFPSQGFCEAGWCWFDTANPDALLDIYDPGFDPNTRAQMPRCVSCGGPVEDHVGGTPVCSWECQVSDMARSLGITEEALLNSWLDADMPGITQTEADRYAAEHQETLGHELDRIAYSNRYGCRH